MTHREVTDRILAAWERVPRVSLWKLSQMLNDAARETDSDETALLAFERVVDSAANGLADRRHAEARAKRREAAT